MQDIPPYVAHQKFPIVSSLLSLIYRVSEGLTFETGSVACNTTTAHDAGMERGEILGKEQSDTGGAGAGGEGGVEIARVQEMPQNGTGVQGGGRLPGNMQQHQPQVMPTSSLEGCSATAFGRLFRNSRNSF